MTNATQTMGFQELCAALQLDAPFAVFAEGFERSAASFPQRKPEFLSIAAVANNCRLLGMSDEVAKAVCAAAASVPDDPAVWLFAWHCHRLLFAEPAIPDTARWPMLPEYAAAPWKEMFYAFIFLSGAEQAISQQQARGVPREITLTTLADLELWICEHRKRHGRFGFSEQCWLVNHFRGRLFSLGRLQYETARLTFDFHVLRNRAGRVMILAGEGMAFREDGQFNGCNGIFSDSPWTATYKAGKTVIRGFAIDAGGNAINPGIELPAADWREIARQGDDILKVHIPATGPLTAELVSQSMEQARGFFPQLFKELNITLFTCESWLMDAQLGLYLRPDANIIRFQKFFHLFPLPGATDRQIIQRVFGTLPDDLSQAPRHNSLQEAVLNHMLSGKHWRLTGGLRPA